MEARVRNFQKWIELWDVTAEARRSNGELLKKRDEAKKKSDQKSIKAVEEYDRKLSEAAKQLKVWTRELERIREEAHTLNLPEEGKRE